MRSHKAVTLFFVLAMLLAAWNVSGQERKIKANDILKIEVIAHEELSRAVVVSAEGTVDYPFLNGVPVEDLTLQQVQDILVAQLSGYMEQRPFVTIRFTDSYPINVTVSGQVANPGVINIASNATLQVAIAKAGGFTTDAQLSKIKLIRKESADNHRLQNVNMETFYVTGDPAYLPSLKDGDTIIVPGNPLAATVKVIGGVKSPGNYPVAFRTSLIDVISIAGGPTEDANLRNIKVTSYTGKNVRDVKIDLDQSLHPNNSNSLPLVHPGDVVYVPQKKNVWKGIISVTRDLAIFATLYVLIRNDRN